NKKAAAASNSAAAFLPYAVAFPTNLRPPAVVVRVLPVVRQVVESVALYAGRARSSHRKRATVSPPRTPWNKLRLTYFFLLSRRERKFNARDSSRRLFSSLSVLASGRRQEIDRIENRDARHVLL